MGPFHASGVEIEDRADWADEFNVQPGPVFIGPFFLLGRGHADPEHIGSGSVNGADHCAVVCIAEFRFERRGIGTGDADIREIPTHLLFDLPEVLVC